MMKALLNLLSKYSAVDSINKGIKGIVSNDSTIEALLIASAYNKQPSKLVIVKNNLYAAQRLYERLEGLISNEKVLFFPVDESFRMEALATSPELLTQRIFILDRLLNDDSYVLITHTAAIVRLLPTVELFKHNQVNLKIGDVIKPEDLILKLNNIGYNRVNKIEHSLQFAHRGGVLDIYSVNNDNPIRLEFFGDEIDSIREFDLDTQRTIKNINNIVIIPATDLIIDNDYYDNKLKEIEKSIDKYCDNYEHKQYEIDCLKERNSYTCLYKYYSKLSESIGCLFDYCNDARVVYSHQNDIKENYNLLLNESFDYLEETKDTSFILHHDLNHVFNKVKSLTSIEQFRSRDSQVEFPLRDVEGAGGNARNVKLILDEYLRRKYRIVLCLDNPNQISCIRDWFMEWNIQFEYLERNRLPSSDVSYTDFSFKEGFELPNEHLVFLSAYEIFGYQIHSKHSYTRYRDGIALQSYDNLEIGDYVVHEVYGIGQFLGIETIENKGLHKDYLHIAYRNNEKLFVPLDQFKIVRKYVSKQGLTPKLSSLSSNEWEKTKNKIKKRIQDITDRLLKLYLTRTEAVGFACLPDEEWQLQFENSFPYELTDDQKKSAREIKTDMEKPYPMDRLLCGDVGFGKTEVAFIAAFKAILNGKQVALLCPTTLLARQHYEVAKERFQNFPINIGIVSRMVPQSTQNQYLKDASEGKINLLIGTHRLLSKDVKFKDLGLLIVDEEQRFGVEHKEKIKELKNGIDVLTLSATPIPRTLQSALLGIRSLSQIDTPPRNRMPIQTYVLEKSERLIKEIIERELSRNGQVFYLHNRVSDLTHIARLIKDQIKGAKVIIIHGKMNHEEIEDAMLSFCNGEANVMICTTIVENGIDIPNANTIIIDEADRFGLSQLYQIKGRVGRGDRLAYAYLFYNHSKVLSEVATKRLSAIKEFAELGSGYRIAMRDLTIRGAGDILGSEQAGFIDTIGMDMYLHLLQEAINEQKTGEVAKNNVTRRDYKLDAYIPKKFTEDDMDKIELYRKINDVNNINNLIDLENELNDVYGKIPVNVKLLIEKRRFEILTKGDLIEDVKDLDKIYEIVLSEKISNFNGIGVDIFKICNDISLDIKITYRAGRIRIRLSKENNKWLDYANEILLKLIELVKEYENNDDN